MYQILIAFVLLFSVCSPVLGSDLVPKEVEIVKSLVDSSTIGEVVETFYFIPSPVRASILSVGVNDIYLIQSDHEKYVLRLSRTQKCFEMTTEEFLFELEWLEFLHHQNVAVSYPIRRTDGALYSVIHAPEGPRYATLFSFAEGSDQLSAEQAYLLGQGLAQLHLASDAFTTTLPRMHLDAKELISDSIERIRHFLENTFEEECRALEETGRDIVKQITTLDLSGDSYGVISGDFHGYNQHFTDLNQLTMFDFEFCAYGYRIYDLATFRWSRGADDPVIWHAFLQGYQTVRPLNEAELQSIDLFVKARQIWWMGALVTLPELHPQLDAQFWKNTLEKSVVTTDVEIE